MYEWFAYLSVCAPCAYSSHKGQKSVSEPPGIVTDDCELPSGSLEPNPGPLQNY